MEDKREFDKLTEILLHLELLEKEVKAIKEQLEIQSYLYSRYN